MKKLSLDFFKKVEQEIYSELRDYQREGVSEILKHLENNETVLRQNFTGTGKSKEQNYLAVNFLSQSEENVYLFLIHREELLDNAAEYFYAKHIPVNFIKSGRKNLWNSRVYLAAVGSMQKTNLEKFQKYINLNNQRLLIILDECHHVAAKTWNRILEAFPEAKKVGFTATPERLDGQGFDKLFQHLILGKSYSWYQEKGYLAPFEMIVPESLIDMSLVTKTQGDYDANKQDDIISTDKVLGDIVEVWKEFALGCKTVLFAPKIHSSELIASKFNELGKGLFGRDIAAHVDGKTDSKLRASILEKFKLPKEHPDSLLILCNVELFFEGINIPDCEVTQWVRKTASVINYDQGNGRSNRPFPGKIQKIIDHVGNSVEHGLPNRERAYFLEGRKKREQLNKWKLTCTCGNELMQDYRLVTPEIEKDPWLRCSQCGIETYVPKVTLKQRKKAIIDNQELEVVEDKFIKLVSEHYEHINNNARFSKLSHMSDKEFLNAIIQYPDVSLKLLQSACVFRGLISTKALSAWSRYLQSR